MRDDMGRDFIKERKCNMEIKNLCSHPVSIKAYGTIKTIDPLSINPVNSCRVVFSQDSIVLEDGIAVKWLTPVSILNLPAKKDGTIYLVSSEVVKASLALGLNRDDLASPDHPKKLGHSYVCDGLLMTPYKKK